MSKITHGVLQGSDLGPLLFLIYINDINSSTRNCAPYLFADDTNLFFNTTATNSDCQIESESHHIMNWLEANRLSLNCEKTAIVNFNCSTEQSFKIGETTIKTVNSAKYLGIEIDKDLKYIEHVNRLLGKLANKTYAIIRLRKYIPRKTL